MAVEYYSGRVHTVRYHNPEGDFYVLQIVLDQPEDDAFSMFSTQQPGPVTVRGNVPGLKLDIGSWLGFEARWETHAKYGRQLVITKAPVVKGGWTTGNAVGMLSAHGVGEAICQRLVLHFGEELVDVLDTGDEERLKAVPSITPFTAAHIMSRWKVIRAYFRTLEFLTDAKVPKNKISEVWVRFGDDAETVLSENPWALVQINGVSFGQADEVAMRLGLDKTSPLRTQGAVLYASKERRGLGHLFLSSGDMLAAVQELASGTTPEAVAKALATLHKQGKLVIDRTTRPGTTAIYEPWYYQLESDCATRIVARVDTADPGNPPPDMPPPPEPEPKPLHDPLDEALEDAKAAIEELAYRPYGDMLAKVGPQAEAAWEEDPNAILNIASAALEDWSQSSHIHLSDDQLLGALNALFTPVSILTGLPGTGKTTTLRAVVSVLKDAGVSTLLCAPTGIAAKRMSTLANAPASTIHRAFKARGGKGNKEREATYAGVVGDAEKDQSDGSGEQWGYGSGNPHPAQVVICDEFSMVDQHLLYRLLSCTKPTTRLVFVGDAAQLPSVGPGNVLRNLITSGQFPTVSLTEIFRQDEASDIVTAAHAVHRGRVPQTGSTKDSDFVLIETPDEDTIVSITTRLVERLYAKRENFQVLSPRHKGTVGVTALNQRLRAVLNPQSPGLQEMRLGSEVVREDDRVMVVKNNYQLGIYNGDVGKIVELDRRAREVVLKLHGPPSTQIRMRFKDAPRHLRLAYCMTVHKSQGQEYDVIVMPLVRGFGGQLQRNLFYTAITRARQRVILIGHRDALVKAVLNDRMDVRNTLFVDRLSAVVQGGSLAAVGA